MGKRAAVARDHVWRFFRAGGLDQVRLDRGIDLASLRQLDPKLWVALACPVKGLELEEATLAVFDGDQDGRVRINEILDAIDWALSRLKDPDALAAGGALELAALDDTRAEGRKVLAAARRILEVIGNGSAKTISVDECARSATELAQLPRNGDGVLPPSAISDPAVAAVAELALQVVGGEKDLSGKDGVTAQSVAEFYARVAATARWRADLAARRDEILPLGDATVAARAAIASVAIKVEDWYARAAIAAYDERALAAIDGREEEYLRFAAHDLTIEGHELRELPLARVRAGGDLPLTESVNPAFRSAIAALREQAIVPLLGERQSLSRDEWCSLLARFTAYDAWIANQPDAALDALDDARIAALLGGPERASLEKALEEDRSLGDDLAARGDVERLCRIVRDLRALLENFVNFADFYSRRRGIFQIGTLYLDGRSCELCFRVEAADKHAPLATTAKTYLAYCECTRKGATEKLTIAAAFTAGDSDHLGVGRNGLFVDRRGRDYDATIVKIVDHPISIRQAFLAPYKRVLRFIEDQVAKRAAAADANADKQLVGAVDLTAQAASGVKPEAKPKIDVGVVAALGVAVGGITTAFGLMMAALTDLGWKWPLAMAGLVLLISGPSMLIAWMKLRQRNLGPILDAAGWAVNGRVLVNLPLGRALTAVATLPPGSERQLSDPYAEKRPLWPWLLFFLAILVGALAAAHFFGLVEPALDRIRDWLGLAPGTDAAPTPVAPPVVEPPAGDAR
jgi:hypothetical protein